MQRDKWIALGLLVFLVIAVAVFLFRFSETAAGVLCVALYLNIAFGVWFSGWLRPLLWGSLVLLALTVLVVYAGWYAQGWLSVPAALSDTAFGVLAFIVCIVLLASIWGWVRFCRKLLTGGST